MVTALYPLTALFKDLMYEGQTTVELYQYTYQWDTSNTKAFIENSGIEEPVIDKALLDTYLKFIGVNL